MEPPTSQSTPNRFGGFDSEHDRELWRYIVQLVKVNHRRFGTLEDFQDAAYDTFLGLKGGQAMILQDGAWRPRPIVWTRLKCRIIDGLKKRKFDREIKGVDLAEMQFNEAVDDNLQSDRIRAFVENVLNPREIAALAKKHGYPPDVPGIASTRLLHRALKKLRLAILDNPGLVTEL